ncbi:MAG: hypothetical protein ACRDKA_01530 [Actinomycetota bacterium]
MAGRDPLIGAAAIDYRGARFVLGRTVDAYAIWDPSVGGAPRRLFPLTADGWAEAWREYRALEAAGGGQGTSEEGAIPPLRIGQIMAVAFALYRRHLRTLAAIAALIVVPFYAVSLTLVLATVRLVPERVGLRTTLTPRVPTWVEAVSDVLLYAFVIPFLSAAIVTAVAWALLDRRPTVADAYRRAARRAHSVLWVSLLAGVAAAAPLVPGIVVAVRRGASEPAAALAVVLIAVGLVPAVFLGLRFVFGTSVVVVEGVRGTKALRRSWRLVRGLTGKVLGGLLLALLILFALLLLLITLALAVVLFRDLTETTVRLALALVSAVTALVVSLVGPYVNLVIVLLYLDARGRKDGLTLRGVAAEVDAGG